jgi:predicted nucleic acid-binding protein
MGLKYLWDTNTIIYYLQNNFAEINQELMSSIISNHQPAISAISQIELLCWRSASENDTIILNNFISDSIIFELDNDIKFKTIEIRKMYGIKLADAIIAATAVVMDLTLITNDSRGFKKIPTLKLFNPIEVA